jgi:hypothetical protein
MRPEQVQHALALVTALHRQPSSDAMIQMTTLRLRGKKGYIPAQRFFHDPGIAVEWALEANERGESVFVSVNPRNEMSSFDTSVPWVGAIFLDLQPERADIPGIIAALGSFGLPPSITVCSGNGVHLYFLMEPCERDAARKAARRLVMATNSDAVFNPSRIARLPGSLNWKSAPKPPTWCYLTDYHPERRYNFTSLSDALEAMKAPHPAWKGDGVAYQPCDPPADWLELRWRLSEHALAIIDYGERNPFSVKQVSRSEADWFVICALVRANATDEDIEAVYRSQPIGQMKYAEAGDGYLARTIERARNHVGDELAPPENLGFTGQAVSRYSGLRVTGSSRDRRR